MDIFVPGVITQFVPVVNTAYRNLYGQIQCIQNKYSSYI